MTDEEIFEALPIGTLLKVREEMLNDPADDSSTLSLRQVVDKDGYLFRFTGIASGPSATFPVQAKSIATGNEMEFYFHGVDPVEKEQE